LSLPSLQIRWLGYSSGKVYIVIVIVAESVGGSGGTEEPGYPNESERLRETK